MESNALIDGLMMYIGLIVLLTFHEFGHAWMALKCGDETAKMEGRVSLNPIVHIDPIGTVILPLMMIFLPGARFLIGWAKPVPVNPSNLRNPKLDDILVTLAGPWMNLLLAVVLIGGAKLALIANNEPIAIFLLRTANLSLLLCFFNLIPIPPLDGSHVARVALGMSYETYWQIARYGFLIVIIVLQIPLVRGILSAVTNSSFRAIAGWFGIPVG